MRIQEMKSGFLHLKKKVENEGQENYFKTPDARNAVIEQSQETGLPAASDCELDEPLWSVVSFDKMEAGGLTYAKAAGLINELDARGVTGLCIVTDEAAARMRR